MDLIINNTIGTTEPVTLDEVKSYLRIKNSQDDTYITSLIKNARMQAEKFLRSDIVPKERTIYFSYIDQPFNLPYAPLNITRSDGDITNLTVTIDDETQTEDEGFSIEGFDSGNPKIFIGSTSNAFRNGDEVGFIRSNKVEVNYTTRGFLGSDDLPMIEQGVLALCAWIYYGREAEMNTNWKEWLSPFRINGYYGQR